MSVAHHGIKQARYDATVVVSRDHLLKDYLNTENRAPICSKTGTCTNPSRTFSIGSAAYTPVKKRHFAVRDIVRYSVGKTKIQATACHSRNRINHLAPVNRLHANQLLLRTGEQITWNAQNMKVLGDHVPHELMTREHHEGWAV